MQTFRLISALASAALLIGTAHAGAAFAQTATTPPMQATTSPVTTPTKAPADMMTVGTPALDARQLRARRTATGYTLTGQALVKDGCQAARFDPSLLTIYPPQFNLNQFRRPGSMGVMCIQRLIWVTAFPRSVTSAAPPAYITVSTKKGVTRVRVR